MLEYENKEWLEKKYLEEKKSSIEIAKICDCTKPTILRWMKKFGIEGRPSGRSVKGKEIFKNNKQQNINF
ncbi:MAG: helix-turn-helix domain-containing protein [Bacteroidales bacterium]|nr:helix-turn-helix domain-containing protein [Bacteroidales bacterium]